MVLEQFITLALSDFTRAGMFTPSTRQQVKFEWNRGTDYASITAVSDFTGCIDYTNQQSNNAIKLYGYETNLAQ